MKKGVFISAALMGIFLMGTMFIACGGGNGGGGGNEPLVLGTPYSGEGNVWFLQTVQMLDSDTYEYFPGQPNIWDINADFSLSDGGDDQFDTAMDLYVDGNSFSDQSYSDLTFYTPEVGASKGIKAAAVVDVVEQNYNNSGTMPAIGGTYSLQVNDIYDGRVMQEVDLTAAAGTVFLSWSWNIQLGDDSFGAPSELNVVLRSPSTNDVIETLLSVTSGEGASYSIDITDHAGAPVVLSYEIKSSGYGPNLIDDISILDAGVTEYVTNGDFETGNLTSWETNSPMVVQNMTSAAETITGLSVARSFYTVPDKVWGRWVDVFQNNTASAIALTVEYVSNLGSDDEGILYMTPGTGGQSLTGWDGDGEDPPDPTSSDNDRDFAFVFGTVDAVAFTTATALDTSDGSDDIYHYFYIDVPAGGMVTIVNFVIMNGIDTGDTAVDASARATEVDDAALDIVENFWTDGQYRSGMTQEQIDNVLNF